MKYAIVEAGGKQYRAEEGKTITVDLLPANIGDAVTLESVLLVAEDDKIEIGTPTIKGASLKTTVVEQLEGEKILVFQIQTQDCLPPTRSPSKVHQTAGGINFDGVGQDGT